MSLAREDYETTNLEAAAWWVRVHATETERADDPPDPEEVAP